MTLWVRKARLGTISDFEEVEAYLVEDDAGELARADQTNRLKVKATHSISDETNPHRAERKLTNGVTIYGNDDIAGKLTAVIDRYAKIWENPGGFADVP
jgi:hypothetical protein